tara:strand:- start:801 stop:1004 length:204 start_codon:yes stop_codon:yes gene_type:complete
MKITVDTLSQEEVRKAIEVLQSFVGEASSSTPSDFSLPGEGAMGMFENNESTEEAKEEEEEDKIIPY